MSGPYTRLVSGVLFPLQERLKGHTTVAVRRHLEVSQWWSPERLEEYRLIRLRSLLQHAGERVPYYRRLFAESGFDPAAVTEIADLRRLPFLTKGDIRAHADDLKADDARGLARCNTGGSSGEPLIFWLGPTRVSHDVAAKWRATRWWGVDIGDPEIVVWGSPVELNSQDRVRALRDRLIRTQLLPAFDMSARNVEAFLDTISRMRPRMLFGYPSALSHIAGYAEGLGRPMDRLGIQVAFVTSERLYEHQRETIERVFGCPVANGYGGRDAGFIAHQCPAGGMHITAEDIIVETVTPAGEPAAAGEAGEVVVTHLATGEYPFIRYRTGDVAVLDDTACPCGRGLPLLKEIQGRTTDFVTKPDGTVMHGLALIYVLRDLPEVAAFKIIQQEVDRVSVQVVPGDGYGRATADAIRSGLLERLGGGVEVEVEAVERLEPEASGKFRYVVSRVPVGP